MNGELQAHDAEEPAEVSEQRAFGAQATNLWRAAYRHAEVLVDRFDRRSGPSAPAAVDRAERAIQLVMLSYAITATATAAGIVLRTRDLLAAGHATLAGVSLMDLSQNHLPAGALFKEFLVGEQGREPRPGDPGYEVYVELRNRMTVADSTAADAFDDWERHCTALSRIVTGEVLHQLTRDHANPGADVTLAMLASH
jgi:hypothetical protein